MQNRVTGIYSFWDAGQSASFSVQDLSISSIATTTYSQYYDTVDINSMYKGFTGVKKQTKEKKMILDRKTIKNLKIYFEPTDKLKQRKRFIRLAGLKKMIKLYSRTHHFHEKLSEEISLLRKNIQNKSDQRLVVKSPKHNISTFIKFNNGKLSSFSSYAESRRWALNRIKDKIKEKRRYERENVGTITKYFKGKSYRTKGLVHVGPATILNIHKTYKYDILRSEKEPNAHDNYIGIELEFFAPDNSRHFEKCLIKEGLEGMAYIKGDASIEWEESEIDGEDYNDWRGYELTILAKEEEVYNVVDKVSKVLFNIDARTNETCGLHVHLDMRNKNYKRVYYNLASMESLLYKMVDKDRSSNEYCRKVTSSEWDDSSNDHYVGINGKGAYARFETIEVRMHQGTINKKEIKNWIKLLLKISNYKRRVSGATLDVLNESYMLDKELFKYYDERIKYNEKLAN